ncbi:hypothetical protein [Piscinibacter gummiphilus]|uniref:Uncharacterized protein n=1 Tax=Piscinibacter gummiphilus TaxID=946333 RepID=A0ABZ0D1Y2_9BURK|nr:hypothetical protein [Piscinibacter gummiphilus]WOB11260.1 hypothetical protein RXV79_26885 [Piscinibacter gummiphilus]
MNVAQKFMKVLLTVRDFRNYWKPVLLLAIGTGIYAVMAADSDSLRAKVDASPSPSVDLFAQALANLFGRLAGLALIIWGALRASPKTWVAGAICFVLARIAPVQSGWHWGAFVLGVVCLVITWHEVHEDEGQP